MSNHTTTQHAHIPAPWLKVTPLTRHDGQTDGMVPLGRSVIIDAHDRAHEVKEVSPGRWFCTTHHMSV